MKLVVFDVDGTLTDTNTVDQLTFVQTFKDLYNIDVIDLNWNNCEHVTDPAIYNEVFEQYLSRKPSAEELASIQLHFDSVLKSYGALNEGHFNLIEGVKEMLEDLKANEEWAVAIATGCWSNSALTKLGVAGIDISDLPFGNADKWISRQEITLDAIRLAEEKHGHSFEKTVYVGDGEWDFTTCQSLGLPLIGIDVHQTGKLTALGLEHVVHDYVDKAQFYQYLAVV